VLDRRELFTRCALAADRRRVAGYQVEELISADLQCLGDQGPLGPCQPALLGGLVKSHPSWRATTVSFTAMDLFRLLCAAMAPGSSARVGYRVVSQQKVVRVRRRPGG
jgi:hypothetical protein